MPKAKRSSKEQQETHAIQFSEHSRYQIKSGWLAGTFVARAFPKPPTNARGMIAEATGATEESAIAALHNIIDARQIQRTDDRRTDPTTGYPIASTDEFVEAVTHVALSRPQRAILTALALAEEEGLSEVRLASAAGYKSKASANRALASAGLLIADYLSLGENSGDETSESDGTMFLGYRGPQRNEEDLGNWVLHIELREAVKSSG